MVFQSNRLGGTGYVTSEVKGSLRALEMMGVTTIIRRVDPLNYKPSCRQAHDFLRPRMSAHIYSRK